MPFVEKFQLKSTMKHPIGEAYRENNLDQLSAFLRAEWAHCAL